MVGFFHVHVFASLLQVFCSVGNVCSATAGCEAVDEAERLVDDEMLLIQRYHATMPKRNSVTKLSALAPTKSLIPSVSVLADVQKNPTEEGVPSWRPRPLLLFCAAALGLSYLQGLASICVVSGSLAGPTAQKPSHASAEADKSLPPGVFVATMACAFLSEASCTAAMPTAHLCAGGLLSSVCFWLLGRLASAPLFWHLEKQGLAQFSLAVHCIAMASGQVLYGMCAAKLLLFPTTVTETPLAVFQVLMMAGRVMVGFASSAQFAASAAIVAQAGVRRRTEYLCYSAIAGGVGALAGPGLGSFSLAGAKTELEMLLPCALLAGASLFLLYSSPALNDGQASVLVLASEVDGSLCRKHQAAGAIALNIVMQLMRQAMCLLWEAGTATVLVKQFGFNDQEARTFALGIVATSLLALAVWAKLGLHLDERILLMCSSSIAAFGCCVHLRFGTVADGPGMLALSAFAGYFGSFLSLAPMLAFAGKAACSDASGAKSPSTLAAVRQVLMGHHIVSSTGAAMTFAALWAPSSGITPQPPGLEGSLMYLVLMLAAVKIVTQIDRPWRSLAKLHGAHAQQ